MRTEDVRVIVEQREGDDPKLIERVVGVLGPVLAEIDLEVKSKKHASTKKPVDDAEVFDTLLCPAGAAGVNECFYGENKWQWVPVHAKRLPSIDWIAIYETERDHFNKGKPGGRGAVIAYAPVLGHEQRADGKYSFELGEIITLERPIPAGGVILRASRYVTLSELLAANTLDDLF